MTATMILPAAKCGEMPSMIVSHIGLFLLRVINRQPSISRRSGLHLRMLRLRQPQYRSGFEPPAVEMRRGAAIGCHPMAVAAGAVMADDSDQIPRRVEARDHAGDGIALAHDRHGDGLTHAVRPVARRG